MKKVKQFDNFFAQNIGKKYAIAINSGAITLHPDLITKGSVEGDEVII